MRNSARGSVALADKPHTVPPTVMHPRPAAVSTKPSTDGPESAHTALAGCRTLHATAASPAATPTKMTMALSLLGMGEILAAKGKTYKGHPLAAGAGDIVPAAVLSLS